MSIDQGHVPQFTKEDEEMLQALQTRKDATTAYYRQKVADLVSTGIDFHYNMSDSELTKALISNADALYVVLKPFLKGKS